MNRLFVITALVITLIPSVLFADVSGQVIAFNCYACHGERLENLKQSNDISSDQLLALLLALKNDKESSSIMNRISRGYTDYELELVAAYIKNSSPQ
jgi:cytochrome c553